MRPALCVSLAVCLLAVGCGGGGPGPAPVATVTLRQTLYTPADLSLKVGDAVEWVWADGNVPHNIDGASDLSDFDSGTPTTTGTWRYRFGKAGTYSYHCDVHPQMMGTVVVS
jgi:plastocyanin